MPQETHLEMPSSGALWQICRNLRAAPLDKKDPGRKRVLGIQAVGSTHFPVRCYEVVAPPSGELFSETNDNSVAVLLS